MPGVAPASNDTVPDGLIDVIFIDSGISNCFEINASYFLKCE